MNPIISFHRNLLQVDYTTTTTTTTVSPPPYQPQSPYPLSPFHNSLVLTVIILLSIICFISFVTLYVRHFSDSPNSSNESPRARASPRARKRTGVKLEDVERIPVVSYEGEMKIWNECSICLSEFEEKESVKVIPFCKHVFHPTCIDTWLASHVSCPMCRSTELFLAVDDEGMEEKEEDRTVEEMHE